MSNTLTDLIPDLYAALDVVSRELVGFIPAVTMDSSVERAAVNQDVLVPITPAAASENVTPGSIPPDTGDQVVDNTAITITKSKAVPFRWTGEEQKGINSGVGYQNLRVQQIAQAMRTLVNEIEVDLGLLFAKASRAYGIAGTAPFGSSPALGDAAQILKILKDNGAPEGDLHLVINSSAGAALRTLTQLTKANEGGGDQFLRQGVLLPIFGMDVRESAGVANHNKGTGASYLSDHATYAIGDKDLHVDTGTGTILPGDVVTFAGDANKYVVGTGFAGDGDGDISLNKPGLRATLANDVAMTVGNSFAANLAFSRSAIILATRAPALPEEGDMAEDSMMITDPRSGLSFEVRKYLQYRRVRYEVSMAWGVANIKPEHTAILLG